MNQQLTIDQFNASLGQFVQRFGVAAYSGVWPRVAQQCVSDVKKNINEGHGPNGEPWAPLAHARPGGKAGIPLRDNGLLLASINARPEPNGVTVGSGVLYAATHQYGAHIVPRRSKFLAIPLTLTAKRAGSPRNFPGDPDWRFIPTRTGGWIMAAPPKVTQSQGRAILTRRFRGQALTGRQKERLRPVPQYVLVREVLVPARPFLGFSPDLLRRVNLALLERTRELWSADLRQGGGKGTVTLGI